MISKINKFYPNIKLSKIFLLALISFGYGAATIITIYIVTSLVSIISGVQTLDTSVLIVLLTDILKSNFDLNAKLSHIVIGFFSLTLMVILGSTKIYYVAKIVSNARHDLSLNILKKSLKTNSVFKDKTHVGNMKTLILDETFQISAQLLKPTIEIMASLIFIFVILINLFFYDPKITILATIIFSVAYLISYLSTQSLIKKHGQARLSANKQRFKKVDDALSLRLLSNVLKTTDLFTSRFTADSKKMARHVYLFEFIQQFPKIIIEAIIFLVVFLMVVIGLNDVDSKAAEIIFVQSMVFFALSGLKMLPEFQRIYQCLGLLKFGSASQEGVLNVLNFKDLPIFEKKFQQKILSNKNKDEQKLILEFECDACFNGDAKILKKINLNIFEGDRIAITGKSGSGKTTLLNALMGIIPIDINGEKGFFKSDAKVGYLPQETNLFSGTVLENIHMGRELSDKKYNFIKDTTVSLFPEFKIKTVDTLLNRLIDDVSTGLSVGQKQRVGLLRAIYDNPEILILDEFTSALDKKNEEIIINYIDNFKVYKSLIVVGHNSASIKICKKIYTLNNGEMFEV
jgi:ABC-type multidrug transport system fused ATPase/permease subunit